MTNLGVRYNILVDFDSHESYEGNVVYKCFAQDVDELIEPQVSQIDGIEKINWSVIVRLG